MTCDGLAIWCFCHNEVESRVSQWRKLERRSPSEGSAASRASTRFGRYGPKRQGSALLSGGQSLTACCPPCSFLAFHLPNTTFLDRPWSIFASIAAPACLIDPHVASSLWVYIRSICFLLRHLSRVPDISTPTCGTDCSCCSL
jgi:hypothetical protein